MTRRDRAAMRLAYEECRSADHYSEVGMGELVHAAGEVLSGMPVSIMRWPVVTDVVPVRFIRARLALFLRALLRADAGDRGAMTAWYCSECRVETQHLCLRHDRPTNWAVRRHAPLWSSTPYIGPTLTQPSRTWSGAPERRE